MLDKLNKDSVVKLIYLVVLYLGLLSSFVGSLYALNSWSSYKAEKEAVVAPAAKVEAVK